MTKIVFLLLSLGFTICDVPCFANASGNNPTKVPKEKYSTTKKPSKKP